MTRRFNDTEARILDKLVSVNFEDHETVRRQIQSASVIEVDDSGSAVSVDFKTAEKQKVTTKERVPVRGETVDSSGAHVYILLHIVDGFANELEIVRADGEPLQMPLDIANLTVGRQV